MIENKKIKIAFVSHFPTLSMGGQRSMLFLIQNLNKEKFEPYCILPEEGELSEALIEAGCKLKFVPLKPLKPKHYFQIIKNYFSIRNFLKKEKIDIIHPDYERDVLLSGLAKNGTKTKMVWHVRLTGENSHDEWNSKLADGIIAISRGAKNRFAEDIQYSKVEVIFNGVDMTKFSPAEDINKAKESLGIAADKISILFAGQYKIGKGILDLLDAINLLENSIKDKIRIYLAGNPVNREFLEIVMQGKIEEYKLQDVIIDKGFQDNIHEWMQACDALILPSHEGAEGMGRVIFEALACNCAILGSDISGVNEAFDDETGIAFQDKNPQAIADAITRLVSEEGQLEKMQSSARQRALELFDIKVHARKVEEFYLKVLAKP
jgi:glycosyltransferase involved in cell wall biosynthesis